MLRNTPFIKHYDVVSIRDIDAVGGKNASLGELTQFLGPKGVRVPEGFCVSTTAFRHFLKHNELEGYIHERMRELDQFSMKNLSEIGESVRKRMLEATMPDDIVAELTQQLAESGLSQSPLAVRSSATMEDLVGASFAGQHDSFLNVCGSAELVTAIQRCFSSLYTDRAIKYRSDRGVDQSGIAISVGVQRMIRSDLASSGVIFSHDPESGFRHFFYLSSTWGLCENIVQGSCDPDEYYLYKPSIGTAHKSLVYRRLGNKELTMVLRDDSSGVHTANVPTPKERQRSWSLDKNDAEKLAEWSLLIERHYNMPMDIEFAKDGLSNELFIVQARPLVQKAAKASIMQTEYKLLSSSRVLCSGKAIGQGVVSGRVCIMQRLEDAVKVQEGDIIVADTTSPDWNAVLSKSKSIVTNRGGRTSHASIIARELGIPAVVGCTNATAVLQDGAIVTVVCIAGEEAQVYEGELLWEARTRSETEVSHTQTKPMLILADPDKAMRMAQLPNAGVGLMRMEFVVSRSIRVHPMALVHLEKLPPDSHERHMIEVLCQQYERPIDYFIETLSEAIAMVTACFAPKDVILRFSDFKTNEYSHLIGGSYFESEEENPMLGFRGASRYYHERYREAFALECAAVRQVRNVLGLRNLKVMIPFCRTVDEAKKVLHTMSEYGLTRGDNGLEIYLMAEIPSNIILADQFAPLVDGFSIGSNDLTQLVLGVDRDSTMLAPLFDESNEAVLSMIRDLIERAHAHDCVVGLCGQAPSDKPEFARFLVHHGIDSISFNADALLKGIHNIAIAEKELEYP